MAVNYEVTLRDYLSILRRRRWQMAIAFVLIFAISAIVVVALPPTYRSTGTILVESPQIPDELIRSTVTSYADERIAVIKQRVLTRGNLLKIIDKYGLFGDRKTLVDSEVLDRMRERVTLELIGADQAKGGKTTIAFKLSYDDSSKETAFRVANELVTLYLDENVKTRTARAIETTEFLTKEADRMKVDLEALEMQISGYKERYGSALPENLQMHMSMRDRIESEIQELDREYKSLQGERRFLDIQLNAAKSGVGSTAAASAIELDPATQLARLRTEYARMSGLYKPNHPDIVSLKRQIDSLAAVVEGGGADSDGQLAQLKAQYAKLAGTYKENHPDLVSLKREIEALEAGKGSGMLRTGMDSTPVKDLAVAKVQASISSAEARLASIEQQRRMLTAKRAQLEGLILRTPEAERGLVSLLRDYENAKAKYEEVRSKELGAKVAENMEEERKAERFSLIEPPLLPDVPIKPKRTKLMVMGFFLALLGSGGLAMLLESINPRIRGMRALGAVVGTPPLVAIPYIATREEVLNRKDPRKLLIAGAVIAAVLIVTLIALHFLYQPLDMLMYKILGRLES